MRGAKCDVYVGRGSIWGNPFSHLRSKHTVTLVADRATAITAHAVWIQDQPELLALIPTLRAKRLGCYCAPLPCHAEILARMANT